MNADTRRRLTVFGAGMLLGLPLAVGLFQYASKVQQETPRETDNVEVVLTKCALQPGDKFDRSCVQRRVVARHFVPPDVIAADNVESWIDRELNVALEEGSAVRTVDFAPLSKE